MTIWTITAKNPDGTAASVPDFDDGDDITALYAHLVTLAPLTTNAVPQTPVSDPYPPPEEEEA